MRCLSFIAIIVLSLHPSFAGEELERFVIRELKSSRTIEGRLVFEGVDGGIWVEDRAGRLISVPGDEIESREVTSEAFVHFTADELALKLKQEAGPDFEILQTDHYVICSSANSVYTEFCGKLLELVFQEFFEEFAKSRGLSIREPSYKLPIVIFATPKDFGAYASRQHPEVDFSDTPGYYTVRDNQVLLLDLSGDRSMKTVAAIRRKLAEKPLQIATVVHETVHQLCFNSGLQVRMADNPLWLSEGIALWFEQGSSRASLLWSRPGQVSVRHHPVFVQMSRAAALEPTLQSLLNNDRLLQEAATAPAAYAESWALVTWLMKQHREGFDKYLKVISERKPFVRVSAEERTAEFEAAIGKSPDEIEKTLIPFISRLRPAR
ncbi:MAG: DUF1570 domain-containing protein [Planctomyces sp.]|nr:DUF1570 domain-containing protein [Planctomyces sp.]